jgi:hypothetical protein
VHAAFREPGGEWGTPVTLASNGGAARVAIDAQGAALVVWTSSPDARVRSSERPPGGTFAPPRDLPGSGSLQALQMDAAGNALVLSWIASTGSKEMLRSSYRPAGASFADARPLATVDAYPSGAGLAMNAAGDAIAIFPKRGGLTASRRPSGGEFGPGIPVTRDPRDGGGIVADVALAGDGTAAVTWRTDAGGFYSDTGRVVIALAPAGGPFERPVTLSTNAQPAADARVALDERGDAAIVWGDPRFSVYAAYRPAGGSFGKKLQLAGPRLGGLPDVAIDGEGRATAAWQQNDGDRIDMVTRDISAAGAEAPAQVVKTAPAFVPLPNPRAHCHPPRSRTLVESREARVYRSARNGWKYGCFFGRGKPFALEFGEFPEVSPPPAIALAGPLVAYVNYDDVCATCGGHTELTVMDLRTGRTANGYGPQGGPEPYLDDYGRIRRMVLRRDTALAFIQRKGAISRVYKMDSGGLGLHRLAKGKGIEARSLRLAGDRVQWRQGGRIRSAPLR